MQEAVEVFRGALRIKVISCHQLSLCTLMPTYLGVIAGARGAERFFL